MQHIHPQKCASNSPAPRHLSPEQYIALLHPENGHGKPAALILPEGENPISWTFDRDVLIGQLPTYLWSTAYVSINRFRGKRGNDNVVALNALFVDLDFHKEAAWKELPPRVVQASFAEKLRSQNVTQPSVFIQSGRGLYAIWLIKELPAAACRRWRAAQGALIDRSMEYGADPACIDEARVLRVPGSINEKSGTQVRVSGGTMQRYGFDALEDSIYRACGRPTRLELQAMNKIRPLRTPRSGLKMPRGLTQKRRHQIILEDLEIYRQHLGGRIPTGQRNVFLHIYATCLTHTHDPGEVEAAVWAMAAKATPDLETTDVRAIAKQAKAKATGPSSNCVSKSRRYTYAGGTIADKLEISPSVARKLALHQVVPREEKSRRHAQAERNRRIERGGVTRDEYMLANNASKTKPWEALGLGRSQYYARKKAGTLPELKVS